MILSFIVGVTFSPRMKETAAAASLTDGKKIISILGLQFEDQPIEQVQRWWSCVTVNSRMSQFAHL